MTKIGLKSSIPKQLDLTSAVNITNEVIVDAFKTSPKSIRHILEHLATTSGKGTRTNLTLISSMDENGLVPKEAICAAAAIEIFHLATLVHDDIIDDAPIRRGVQSVHGKFSKKEAVLCGDYLFCMAFASIADIYEPYTKFVSTFAASVGKICLGELKQLSNNFNTDITFYDYLKTINGKTASLFHISAYGGALIGNSNEKDLRKIARFGTYFGMLFQIVDDCKDYKFKEEEALKPIKNDIISGVISLPLLMAFLREPELRSNAKLITSNMQDVNVLINEVYRLNGVEESLHIAKKYGCKAKEILYSISNKHKSNELTKLLDNQLLIIDNFK